MYLDNDGVRPFAWSDTRPREMEPIGRGRIGRGLIGCTTKPPGHLGGSFYAPGANP
jgi:hypothetical protein